MVNAITKSVPKVFGRITRVGMAASLMTAQLLVAIIGVNQFPGSASALSMEKFGSVAASNGTLVPGQDWNNPSNALGNDANYAGVELNDDDNSELLLLSGFGFNLPLDATVDGIEFKISRYAEKANRVSDNYVSLVKPVTLLEDITNAVQAGAWPKDVAVVTYGSATNKWGQSWTAADVNSPDFGVGISVTADKESGAYVNYISVTVHYTEAPEEELPPIEDVEEEPEEEIVIPEKVTICHRTNSITNPYRKITVDASAVDGKGNNDHSQHDEYGIFDPLVHKNSGDDWADIIPAIPGLTEGLNWTEFGQSIYDNDCIFPTIQETGTVIITKIVEPNTSIEKFAFDSDGLDIDGTQSLDDEIGHNESIVRTNVGVGEYSVSEIVEEGYELQSAICEVESNTQGDTALLDIDYEFDGDDTVTFTVYEDQTTVCTFTNVANDDETGTVLVTKYEDFNRNGEFDDNEPTIEDWTITLDCAYLGDTLPVNDARVSVDAVNCPQKTDETDEAGVAEFNGLDANRWYGVGEVIPKDENNWVQTNITCFTDRDEIELLDYEEGEQDNYVFYLDENETVECYVGNARDINLLLQKSNSSTSPQVNGDVVTYTLIVTLPKESSVSYNTVVTDLPPENFKYNGVFDYELTTASPYRGSDPLVENDPNYQSPGSWDLGTVYPGDVITLTYQTVISNQVSPGDYPDVAFVRGYTTPNEGAVEVLGNSAENPFVQTDVTVVLGQTIGNVSFQPTTAVLGALINTGEKPHPLHYLLPITLVLNALLLVRMASRNAVEKGVK